MLDEALAGIKIAERNINNLRYEDDTILMAESEEELKNLLEIKKDSTKSYLTLVIPLTVACQTPLSMGFSRQEYWSRLPFLSPGELPNPGIELRSST